MKKLISVLVLAIILVGCGSKVQSDEGELVIVNTDSSSYDYVRPLETSYIRFEHNGKDYMEIGQGLVDISKEYFSTSDYDLKEGAYLTDFANDYQPLIKYRESKDNPFGLNPVSDVSVRINATKDVKGPIFVNDIHEINFVRKKNHEELGGVSLALVLNQMIYDEETKQYYTADDDVLYDFATEIAAPKLESYLRKKPELSNVPIVIAVYVTDSSNDSIPGRYIASAQYENRQGKFTRIHHKWEIFSTERGRKADGAIDEQIASMKRSVNAWLPEDVGIVGYGEFKNEQIVQMKISVNVQSKTYTEVEALSRYLGELTMNFDSSIPVKVEVKSIDKTLAVIVRPANSSKVEIIMM